MWKAIRFFKDLGKFVTYVNAWMIEDCYMLKSKKKESDCLTNPAHSIVYICIVWFITNFLTNL